LRTGLCGLLQRCPAARPGAVQHEGTGNPVRRRLPPELGTGPGHPDRSRVAVWPVAGTSGWPGHRGSGRRLASRRAKQQEPIVNQTQRIFIVEDHALLRAGLQALLARDADIEIVGEASNGRDAISAIAQLSPNLVLMDLSMPGMSGIEA